MGGRGLDDLPFPQLFTRLKIKNPEKCSPARPHCPDRDVFIHAFDVVLPAQILLPEGLPRPVPHDEQAVAHGIRADVSGENHGFAVELAK